MSESFKRILRTKSAEQLTNMYRNKKAWSTDENLLIEEEVKNRGLEIFEEPEEWSDEVMEEVDLISPKSSFEKDMAFLTKEKEEYNSQKGLHLASQIVSISSVIVSFSFFYWYLQSVMSFGLTRMHHYILGATAIGITGLILFILKKYIPSLVVSGLSLLITLLLLLISLQMFL